MAGPEQRRAAIDLYDRFTHDGMDRRDFMARMTAIAGSLAAAEALVGAISASPAAAALTDAADPRLITARGPIGYGSPLHGYVAAARGTQKRGVVLVIHENRGLNAHIEDVARRVALAGFFAVAPDQLTLDGGTPANEDQARDMIGKLDLGAAVARTIDTARTLKTSLRHSNGKIGAVGFCWGGGFVDRLAVEGGRTFDGLVAYYGPAPAPADAARVEAPLLLHYAGLDSRVGQTAGPWVAALKAAHKDVTDYSYAGVDHAFNNDTSAERYNKPAADLAWGRTIDFFRSHVG